MTDENIQLNLLPHPCSFLPLTSSVVKFKIKIGQKVCRLFAQDVLKLYLVSPLDKTESTTV